MEYSVELYLLKLLLDPKAFKQYGSSLHLKFIRDNNRLLGSIFESVAAYHEKFPDEVLQPSDLQVWVVSLYPSLSETDIKLLEKISSRLEDIEVKPEIAEQYVQTHLQRVKATELAILAHKVSEGQEPFEKLVSAVPTTVSGGNSGKAVAVNLDGLIEQVITTPGLRFRLKTLSRMLGSLRIGDFGFIFARPETGKTTLLTSEVSYFLDQVESPILWINNEERDSKVLLRLYQSYFGVTQDELLKNRERYGKAFPQGKIWFPDPGAVHRRDIDRVCAALNPSLIIIDQLDKIKGFANDRDDIALAAAYQWARELSKCYAPVLAVSQAGAEAEGKKYLEMDHVFGSKTGKQGEADWMLGIGKTHLEGMENVRHLHVVKNKLVQDVEMDPKMRHGKADVVIIPEIGRYKDYD